MLGEIQLHAADGSELSTLLRMPKRLALLAYLAMPNPGTWHRRDVLLALFWPELDATRARTALRNALYVLRQQLGDEAISTRGDEEISIDPQIMQTDVGQLWDALRSDDINTALDIYRGELLAGLYPSESDGFMRWLDVERGRLKTSLAKAAVAHIGPLEAAGDYNRALVMAERLLEIQADDETIVRRVMLLRESIGDRAGALATFEGFRSRLATDFEAEPSAETLELAQQLRTQVKDEPGDARKSSKRWRVDAQPPQPNGKSESNESLPGVPARNRSTFKWAIAAVVILLLLTPVAARLMRGNAHPARSLLILPMENATGDASYDYLATGIAEDLGERLRVARVAAVKSAARAEWPQSVRNDAVDVGKQFGTDLMVRTHLALDNDSLTVRGEVIDVRDGHTRALSPLRFTPNSLPDLESRLLATVVGTAFRAPIPTDPRPAARRVDAESYRLTLQGWQALLGEGNAELAGQLFTKATRRDPSNARAWSGISSARASQVVTGRMPFDEGASAVEAAAQRALALDSLEGSALANLAMIRGLRERNLAVAESLFARARAAEPANAEIFVVEAALLRHAWQWSKARDAIRIARRLDPLSVRYVEREAVLSLCADSAADALPIYQVAQRLDPEYAPARDGMARALARLGRWDDALEVLGAKDLHGEAGYWKYRAAKARPRLDALITASRTRWVSDAQLGTLYVAVGDVDRGLTLLEKAARAGDTGIYRLPCQPDVDGARDLPRFKALLEYASRTIPR